MKKIALALSLILASTVALADYRGGHGGGYGHGHGGYNHRGPGYGYGGGYYSGNNWIAPAIIGGIIGYGLAQPRYYYQQPTIIYQQPPVIYNNTIPLAGYHYEDIFDASCNCYRRVLVLN
jgi:hypothetical protein